MAKLKPLWSIESYGIYTHWDEGSKALPTIKEFTTLIPAEVDIEFGFTLKALKAKGCKLTWTIYHPHIPDDNGNIMLPFSGDVYVRNNDWDFYLGDTIWLPVNNKTGDWRMTIELNNKIIAEKTFTVTSETVDDSRERLFWKRRGF